MRWSLIVVLLSATSARATPAPEYPLARVDRPILMFANTTEFAFSLSLPTYTSVVDEMGNTVMRRTQIGDNRVLEFGARYSFGALELSASVAGPGTGLGGAIGVGDCGAVTLSLDYSDNSRFRGLSQGLSYGHRVLRVPGRLAVYLGASATVNEVWTKHMMGVTTYGTELSASAFGSVTVELISRLALGVFPSLRVPVADSTEPRGRVSLGEVTQLTFSLRRWDFFAQFGLFDLTRERRQYAGAGFLARF